jgi:ketosteroid isomerase-like protein
MKHSNGLPRPSGDTDRTELGLSPQRSDLADDSSRELTETFAHAVSSGDAESLRSLLGDRVVYQVPGRSSSAGQHHGREHVVAALTQPVASGVVVEHISITETMNDGNRGVVIVFLQGSRESVPFDAEIAFHLQTDSETIIGITEYSGNQYLVDSLLNDSAAAGYTLPSTRRRRRRLRRFR